MDGVRIESIGAGRVDEVAPLFQEMVEHHRAVVAGTWPVHRASDAWAHRRREYVAWLSARGAWMLLAATDDVPAAGYAVVRLHESGATWDIGDTVAELESLQVTHRLRGRGVGAALVDAARDIARQQGATHWLVSVVEANEGAVRFYEREGFRPYYRMLLATL